MAVLYAYALYSEARFSVPLKGICHETRAHPYRLHPRHHSSPTGLSDPGRADFLPDLTLNEIVDTLRYLSRKGQLELIVDRQGRFAVTATSRVFN
jgi:hypothetical protein